MAAVAALASTRHRSTVMAKAAEMADLREEVSILREEVDLLRGAVQQLSKGSGVASSTDITEG